MTEQEKQELLKAALVLVDSMEVGERVSAEQLREAVETVKKHRPRPKLVEGWVNAGYNGTILSGIYTAKEYAVKNACTTSTRKGVERRRMSDQQINIAVAAACGWKVVLSDLQSGLDVVRDGEFRKSLPRYCSDLNAMHEAEKVLEHEEIDLWSYYIYELNELIQRNNRVQFAIHATARQRAEAFLRTIDAKEL